MSNLQVSTKTNNDSHMIDSDIDQEYNSLKSPCHQNQQHQHSHSKSFIIKKEPLSDYNYFNNKRVSTLIKTNNNNNHLFNYNNQNNANSMLTSVTDDMIVKDSSMETSGLNHNKDFVDNSNDVGGGPTQQQQQQPTNNVSSGAVYARDNFISSSAGTSSLILQENLERSRRRHHQQQQQSYLEENIGNFTPVIKYHSRKSMKRPFLEDSNCMEFKLQQQHPSSQQTDQLNNQERKQLSNRNLITTNNIKLQQQTTNMNSNEHQIVSINIDLEQDDDSDDETNFDYEPVLTKILNEKKLVSNIF